MNDDPPFADWLWGRLMSWCRRHGYDPAHYHDLFDIVKQAREQFPPKKEN